MNEPFTPVTMTVEEYLEFEKTTAALRHEFIDGQLFAMAGASKAHCAIAGNIYSMLHAHLRGSGCHAYMSDMKVQVAATNSFYYPDVVVSCAPFEGGGAIETAPVLIFEVLSASTTDIDRREKLIAYKQISSLHQYVIVYQNRRLVEVYDKDSAGNWIKTVVTAGENLLLKSLPKGELAMEINEIYEDADVPASL